MRRPFHPALRAAVLAMLAALICWRMPEIVLRGRFWAEEGKYFFQNAWSLPPLTALLTPFGGYLNLAATAGTLGARYLVPLGDAPYVTIALALAVQLITPAILLAARDPWLRPAIVRMLACLLVVLVPASEEIWLQTLHCQFQLTLAAAVIAALEVPAWRAAIPRLLVLLGAPLCGPGAFAVLPVLLLRAATETRDARWRRVAQVGALAAGMAVQLGWFYTAALGRNFTLRPWLFVRIFGTKHVVMPFVGVERTSDIAAALQSATRAGHAPLWSVLLPVAVFGALVLAAWRARAGVVLWLVGTGVGIAGLSYYGALGDITVMIDARLGERYGFVPEALFALGLLALAASARGTTRIVAIAVTAWVLAVGVHDYRDTWRLIREGPSWHGQIKRWRHDPAGPIGLWPEGWTLTLAPHGQH